MPVKIAEELLARIRAHGEETYPEECGGLLVGPSRGVVTDLVPLVNQREDGSRHNRVALDPLQIAKADREASRRGLGVWGFYHSHPDVAPIPSAFDLEHAAFVEWSYVIVSILEGKAHEVRCWALVEDRSEFVPEEITICPPS